MDNTTQYSQDRDIFKNLLVILVESIISFEVKMQMLLELS